MILAQARHDTEDDCDEIQRVECLLDQEQLSSLAQCHLHCALGKMHDDCRNWEQAFSHYATANRLAPVDYDGRQWIANVDATIATFDRASFERAAVEGNRSKLPVLIKLSTSSSLRIRLASSMRSKM